jgi:hypothetical protein
MRLLNTQSFELSRLFVPTEVPDYAILSHRWNTEEIIFADLNNASTDQVQHQMRMKNGFAKIQGACQSALKDGYEWIWIDSCCIDKSSSAELQEAINSMWRYYAQSNVCYVYLADVPDAEAGWGPMFAESEWFTRGWTLQELIAPESLEFFAKDWTALGTKFERYMQIAEITSIDANALIRALDVDSFCAAERLSWAAHRKVTREEDEAYSLLGLFDVNMPLLYGEGREKAFVRLQEAIYTASADQSIFLYHYSRYEDAQPLLASSLTSFCDKAGCVPCLSQGTGNRSSNFGYRDIEASERWSTQAHEQIMTTVTTSRYEMSATLPLLAYRDVSSKLKFFENGTPYGPISHVAVLNHTLAKYKKGALCLLLHRDPKLDRDACRRLQVLPAILPHLGDLISQLQRTRLLICPGTSKFENESYTDITFFVKSESFRVKLWDSKGGDNHSSIPSALSGQPSGFKVHPERFKIHKRSPQISCEVSDTQDPETLLTIELVRMHGIWSIKRILERPKNTSRRKKRTLCVSNILIDRCSCKLSNGQRLSVKLRRMPGSARGGEVGVNPQIRHEILVDYL